MSLKFFNRENSIQNFGEQIGYTQGLGLSYNIEFDNLRELFNELFLDKDEKIIDEFNKNKIDDQLPNYIEFK
ncbi:MAG: hypothetical protein ACJ0P6_00865 [Flavobacteriaceae bacterium]